MSHKIFIFSFPVTNVTKCDDLNSRKNATNPIQIRPVTNVTNVTTFQTCASFDAKLPRPPGLKWTDAEIRPPGLKWTDTEIRPPGLKWTDTEIRPPV